MPSPEAPAPAITREEVRFRSGDGECAGVFVRPDGDGPHPCVVAAHGFGAVKEGGPVRVVERFAAAGFAGVAFDYRHWGESRGEPRELLDIAKQHADYRAAIDFAVGRPEVDADRVALWGSSFSGGHVVCVAAADERVAAVISQVAHMDGVATARGLGVKAALGGTAAGLRDQVGALLGREPYYVPVVGEPSSDAAMAGARTYAGFASLYDEGFEWPNRVAARIFLRLASYSPASKAADVSCPLLVVVCADDEITPTAPGFRVADRAPKGELITYAGLTHFEIYRGEGYERAMDDQLEFLFRHLNPAS